MKLNYIRLIWLSNKVYSSQQINFQHINGFLCLLVVHFRYRRNRGCGFLTFVTDDRKLSTRFDSSCEQMTNNKIQF
ncbi:hypothetical protein EZS27_021132 [termite gut metagenome]|uniref:Uncharacterized protein n=1 Tax=termite gut metagenome TaxID=433724 RepID=A0A5J4RAH6_9ZZZZ